MVEENLITIYKDFIDYTVNQHSQIIRANLLFDRHLFHLLTNSNGTNTSRSRRLRSAVNDNNRLFSLFIPTTNTNTSPIHSTIANPHDRLSLDFIQQNTTTNVFNRLTDRINTSCPITRNEFTDESIVTQINGCNHCFETTAINHWFLRGHTTCPSCRFNLVEQSTPNNTTSIPPTSGAESSPLQAELTSILFDNTTRPVNQNITNLTRNLFNIATELHNQDMPAPVLNSHVTSFS